MAAKRSFKIVSLALCFTALLTLLASCSGGEESGGEESSAVSSAQEVPNVSEEITEVFRFTEPFYGTPYEFCEFIDSAGGTERKPEITWDKYFENFAFLTFIENESEIPIIKDFFKKYEEKYGSEYKKIKVKTPDDRKYLCEVDGIRYRLPLSLYTTGAERISFVKLPKNSRNCDLFTVVNGYLDDLYRGYEPTWAYRHTNEKYGEVIAATLGEGYIFGRNVGNAFFRYGDYLVEIYGASKTDGKWDLDFLNDFDIEMYKLNKPE